MKNPDFKWLENGLETRLYIQHSVTCIQLSFQAFLYQTADHLNTQNSSQYYSFYLFREGQIPAAGCIHFTKQNKVYTSPARSPFGGIQCDEKCTSDEICFFLGCIDDWFNTQDNYAVNIKTAPQCYHPARVNNLFGSAYQLAGYNVSDRFTNYHIPISTKSFSANITSAERRRLSRCKKTGFGASLYDNPDIKIVYHFIQESRDAKKYLMSVTLEQLNTLLSRFPQHCLIFIVTDKEKIIALTVTILVGKNVLYNFLPADLPSYKNFSPTVYLIEAVYNYCQKEKIAILDLGISLDSNGNEKPGLLKFKKNIGAQASLKITYAKKSK